MNKIIHKIVTGGGMLLKTNRSSISLLLLSLTVLSAGLIAGLTNLNSAKALTSTGSATLSFTFRPYCTLSFSQDSVSGSLSPGTSGQIGSPVKLTIACNDPNGYSVYANGLGSSGEFGKTDLIGSIPDNSIKTGTADSGDTSNWNFKLASPSEGLSITEGFDAAHEVPSSSTLVASRASGLSAGSGDTVDVSYSAYISTTQPADTYAAQVSYFLLQLATPTVESMQNFSCSSLAADQTTTLFDARDGNTYTVAKLKDDKCWMTENLRLGKSSTITLTPTDSDVSAEYTLPASSSTGFTSGQNDIAWAYVDGTYGGYYSWCAATAGTCSSATSQGQNAPSSICPKGWRLPTGGSGGEQEVMANKYGSSSNGSAWTSALQAAPAHFNLSGYYQNSTFNAGGSNGRWWSSTAYSSAAAYNLLVYTTNVTPTANHGRYIGRPIRCIAE